MGLELVTKSHRNHWIESGRRGGVVDLGLFCKDVALECRIRSYVGAVESKGVAGASGEAQGCTGHALVNGSDVEARRKMAFTMVREIAPAEQEHWTGFAECQLPISGKRAGWVARVVCPAQRERLSAGNRRLAR